MIGVVHAALGVLRVREGDRGSGAGLAEKFGEGGERDVKSWSTLAGLGRGVLIGRPLARLNTTQAYVKLLSFPCRGARVVVHELNRFPPHPSRDGSESPATIPFVTIL